MQCRAHRQQGVDWFQKIGKPKNTGTKIFQISGHVQRPGCYEFPFGVSLREVLDAAGGCAAWQKI